MLSEAAAGGWVEEIPIPRAGPRCDERWFREKSTGEVYSLSPPDHENRSYGAWEPVDASRLFPSTPIAVGSRSVN
jgi:hypothetical protein